MSDLAWFQNKIVSIISLITAIVSAAGLVVSIMWYGRVQNQVCNDLQELKAAQIEQIKVNTRVITILEGLDK